MTEPSSNVVRRQWFVTAPVKAQSCVVPRLMAAMLAGWSFQGATRRCDLLAQPSLAICRVLQKQ